MPETATGRYGESAEEPFATFLAQAEKWYARASIRAWHIRLCSVDVLADKTRFQAEIKQGLTDCITNPAWRGARGYIAHGMPIRCSELPDDDRQRLDLDDNTAGLVIFLLKPPLSEALVLRLPDPTD